MTPERRPTAARRTKPAIEIGTVLSGMNLDIDEPFANFKSGQTCLTRLELASPGGIASVPEYKPHADKGQA